MPAKIRFPRGLLWLERGVASTDTKWMTALNSSFIGNELLRICLGDISNSYNMLKSFNVHARMMR